MILNHHLNHSAGIRRLGIFVVVFLVASGLSSPAAEINRGPSKASGATTAATSAPVPTANTAAVAQRAKDALNRSTQALQAIQAAQAAARSAALSGPNNLGINPNNTALQLPNVPDGLAANGLVTDAGLASLGVSNPVTTWTGAKTPTQTAAGGKTTVTIQQTQQQALLNWQTFNIGKNTTLSFDQSAGGTSVGQWVAINKINDPSTNPTQILGNLQAPGQVYVINRNGILFGGSSQVNTHALVASSLPINDNLVSRGLLNNPDYQFLFTSLSQSAGTNGTPAFTPASLVGPQGDVIVQSGAQLTSPTSDNHVGGKIALVGPNVKNNGTITTPDGQTILAAGQQVGFTASSDASLRGLNVYIGKAGTGTGTATNNGLIDAPRADTTIAGKTVEQLGFINSSTSVSLNGRIDLLADYDTTSKYNATSKLSSFDKASTGTVRLGTDSVTQILPETTSSETVVGTQLSLPSKIKVEGLAIHMEGSSQILAPSATVDFNAGSWLPQSPLHAFTFSNGQIYLDSSAAINVAGSTDVAVSVTQNVVSVQLRGSELADSPLQRTGALRGQTVDVDIRQIGTYNGKIWVGSPIGDTTGYIGLIQRGVGQLTTSGGTVNLKAGESVILQSGSNIDVSGGYVSYQGGLVKTTKVISGANVYDISKATPDRVYSGIYQEASATHNLTGGNTITETWTSALGNQGTYEAGYVQGADAGSVNITAPAVALNANFYGNSVAGPRQRASIATINSQLSGSKAINTVLPIFSAPKAGTFSLLIQNQESVLRNNQYFTQSPNSLTSSTPLTVTLGSNLAAGTAPDAFSLNALGRPNPLRTDLIQNVSIDPVGLSANGFGNLSIDNSDGNIRAVSGLDYNGLAFGSLALSGANVDIEGKIRIPSGTVSVKAYNFSPYAYAIILNSDNPLTPAAVANRGLLTLGSTATLSAAGLVVDDRVDPATPQDYKGGSISLSSYSADLKVGSVIDASGGVYVSTAGKFTYGDGGSISIRGGKDPNISTLIGGSVSLHSTLLGYSGSKAGSLDLLAPLFQIGGNTSNSDTVLLQPEFFSLGGFGTFALTGLGKSAYNPLDPFEFLPAIHVVDGTSIQAVVGSLIVDTQNVAPGMISLVTLATPKREGVRTAASLSFSGLGIFDLSLLTRADVVVGTGASIQTDAGGQISLSGDTVAMLGSLYSPGGTISISGKSNITNLFSDAGQALPTVDLGPGSLISVKGKTVLTDNSRGFRTGRVLAGGNITIAGNIVVESGSVLDVSGTHDQLDQLSAYTSNNSGSTSSINDSQYVSTRVESNAGSITLKGGQELYFDGKMLGKTGGSSAQGGRLSVTSGRFVSASDPAQSPADVTLQVKQSGTTLPTSFYPTGQTAIGHAVVDGQREDGHLTVDSFGSGGFEALSLLGTVQFQGAVNVQVARSVTLASSGVVYADGAVSIVAPYVSLGTTFSGPLSPDQLQAQTNVFFDAKNQPVSLSATYGLGSLNVQSSLIDVGNTSLQGIGSVSLTAAHGDIRGDGTFDMAGDLSLTAAQIYPPTGTKFLISVDDYTVSSVAHRGSVTIAESGSKKVPLSAGGELDIYASKITQGGVLRAPIGTIQLGWDGTGTAPVNLISGLSVSVTQNLDLVSGSVTSVSSNGATIPYGLDLNGVSWIDPSGTDITVTGVPQKKIGIAGVSVQNDKGSIIDIQGGGDLLAYRFVKGQGGSQDILGPTLYTYNSDGTLNKAVANTSYAILPGYDSDYAPYAAYNLSPTTTGAANLGTDTGYTSNLKVGDRIYLDGGGGLPSGSYTLLPARYALLSGAYLISPGQNATTSASLTPTNPTSRPDGSTLVAGYRFNDLNPAQTAVPLYSSFEIAPSALVKERAEYTTYSANTTLKAGAQSHDAVVPRLPVDSGQLQLSATQALQIGGTVLSHAGTGGRGGQVDIGSPSDIVIVGDNTDTSGYTNKLILSSSGLSAFGAESLLIGGVRQSSTTTNSIKVVTDNITVDNAGFALTGPDVILASKNSMTLVDNAEIKQIGTLSGSADSLQIGQTDSAGNILVNGNGTLLRASSDSFASVTRVGVNTLTSPKQTIGANVQISGVYVSLDSTSASQLDSSAVLTGSSIQLSSGQISLQFANATVTPVTTGLVLSGSTLQTLQTTAKNLSFLSYSTLDIYGTGQIGAVSGQGIYGLTNLSMHAPEIRGFGLSGGTVTLNAQNVALDNSPGRSGLGAVSPLDGNLVINTGKFVLGSNQLLESSNNQIVLNQFAGVSINAAGGVLAQGKGGLNPGLSVQGDLTITAPLITSAAGTTQTIQSGGALQYLSPTASGTIQVTGGLGARLTLQGFSVVTSSNIVLPSGDLSIRATGGNVEVGGNLSTAGTVQHFYDVDKYTDAGQITLTADQGSILLDASGSLNVSAQSRAGNAGSVILKASNGMVTLAGGLTGTAGSGGKGGEFSMDVNSVPGNHLSTLNTLLNTVGFSLSRSFRVRGGSSTDILVVDGNATTKTFNLSTDKTSLQITGKIDASGVTGGSISFSAGGNIELANGSELNVSAQKLDNASKGGSIALETTGGRITLGSSSTMNLSVAGSTGGTVLLRAPQTGSNPGSMDVAVDPLVGHILNASSIAVYGTYIQNANTTSVASIDAYKNNALSNADNFINFDSGSGSNALLMQNRLLTGSTISSTQMHIRADEEIINSKGGLVLNNDWDLSTSRFGSGDEPGMLTLRAAGNITFNGSLSDGFLAGGSDPNTGSPLQLWQNPLMAPGSLSWSYRITAGADLTAVDYHQVLSTGVLGSDVGSVKIGVLAQNGKTNISNPTGVDATVMTAIQGYYQVIRTGTGDIDVSAGRNVQLLNQFATIYTAGSAVADPTMGGTFDLPQTDNYFGYYGPQYSQSGGNVTVHAQQSIQHLTSNGGTVTFADSVRELPNNWLNRRGYVGSDGKFGTSVAGDVASTSWWVNFSNFFEGVGALGGGNVQMVAGNSIENVDAVIPTNARMAGKNDSGGAIAPDSANLVELGGGDLLIMAGGKIDGGVYYVEKGSGSLQAGDSITTNSTRSPSLTIITGENPYDSKNWLPTTLFLGKGNFEVNARGDVLLGPVSNAFLLPQSDQNGYIYKTYFSTYAQTDSVTVSSLSGSVTLREGSSARAASTTPLLETWLQNVLNFTVDTPTAATYQPWLRTVETNVDPFSSLTTILPGTLKVTSFNGDLNVVGNLNLIPSSTGTLDLLVNGSINGLQPNGTNNANNTLTQWGYGRINLSDGSPDSIPGILNPFAYQSLASVGNNENAQTRSNFLDFTFISNLFNESGSVSSVLQTKQSLHGNKVLHADDTLPVHIYANSGNISGLTLYSGKATRVAAGNDITDVALYVQNTQATDTSVVTAGRDIVLYDPVSNLRTAAQAKGNQLSDTSNSLAGDVQISGPGTLEVLAGRNLDLGVGSTNSDGTRTGITSVGNLRNPNLNSTGADIIAGAGLGDTVNVLSLDYSTPGLNTFVTQFLDPDSTAALVRPPESGTAGIPLSDRYLLKLAPFLTLSSGTSASILSTFHGLNSNTQTSLAAQVCSGYLKLDADTKTEIAKLSGVSVETLTSYSKLDPSTQASIAQSVLGSFSQYGAKSSLNILDVFSVLDISTKTALSRAVWNDYSSLDGTQKAKAALDVYYLVLRDSGRDRTEAPTISAEYLALHPEAASYYKNYTAANTAIKTLFPSDSKPDGTPITGDISLTSREIKTSSGGKISLLIPRGGVTVGYDVSGTNASDQGILTQAGGDISIYTRDSVTVGTSRIFTLRGGNEIIWSSQGDIAAGASSKTVQSAPPTRVLIDAQSADVQTDLAGLATGGGIGVLASVKGVPPGDVDLVAPTGTIDAGDAGIRSSGNVNISAVLVLNASNIQVGGSSSGVPSVAAPSLSIGSLTSASATTSASTVASQDSVASKRKDAANQEEIPSIISVEVMGYGGGEGDSEDSQTKQL